MIWGTALNIGRIDYCKDSYKVRILQERTLIIGLVIQYNGRFYIVFEDGSSETVICIPSDIKHLKNAADKFCDVYSIIVKVLLDVENALRI